MRRIVVVALVAAAGCGEVTQLEAGPTDRFYFPTGIAVTGAGQLVVASSNFDLRYADETGGSLIAVDPDPTKDPTPLLGAINVPSFAGQLAIADPAHPVNPCAVRDPAAGAIAVLPIRGENVVLLPRVSAAGAISCDGCTVATGGATRVDPYSVGLACGPGIARAYVGYLRSTSSLPEVTEIDLTRAPTEAGAIRHFSGDLGQVRGFAWDAARERLYYTRTVTGGTTGLRWADLGGGCFLGEALADGGCSAGVSVLDAVPNGLELRSMALASCLSSTCRDAPVRRAYLTARIYDPVVAASVGYRVGDFDGLLLVVDLVETLSGRLDLQVVREVPIGYGASDVAVLPPGTARSGLRDVVVALAADDGVVWVYDDETGATVAIGRDVTQPPGDPTAPTGAPLVGRVPFGFAVDTAASSAGTARVHVGSFQESFVTTIEVPLANPAAACPVGPGGGCVADGATPRRIGGGVAP